MAFVKLHRAILDSTVWMDRDVRDVFITSLLMADPRELREAAPSIKVGSLEPDGFVVPPGWYGFVPAASTGIIHRTQVSRAAGMVALGVLASPDPESKSKEFDGRRMVRIDGGFIILNYFKFRERDETSAERVRRFRERKRADVTPGNGVTGRNVTHVEAEADVEEEPEGDQSAPPPIAVVQKGRPWTAYDWLRKYGAAWTNKYGAFYGQAGDAISKATASFGDMLAELPADERSQAEARAPAMFASYLARDSTSIVNAKHPWAWFVNDFRALRAEAGKPGTDWAGTNSPDEQAVIDEWKGKHHA